MLTNNKKATKHFFLFILLVLMATGSTAQISVNSPYSRFGVGDLTTRKDAYLFSMGGLSMAVSSNRQINPYNPAANYAFDSLSFIFSGGIIASTGNLKTDQLTGRTNYATLGYLLFGFPITHWLKTTIGLTPYSNIGYNITGNEIIENVGSTDFQYSGTGGLNEFYANASVELVKDLAIGAKLSYLFGKGNLSRIIFFPDSVGLLNTRVDDYIEVGDLIYELGLQYHRNITDKLTLGFGGVYAPQQKVNATENYLARSFFPTTLGVESFRDTIMSRLKNKGTINLPDKYGFGFTLQSTDQWMVGADYQWQNWSNYKAFERNDSLQNTMQISIGGEFSPSQSIMANYWSRVKYRAGFRYNKTYLDLRDTRINEFGISFGLGLPIPRSYSTMNVGFEVGKRGTTASGLIENSFLRVTLGIAVWERWFVKNKYN
jgi:hypothetical protein